MDKNPEVFDRMMGFLGDGPSTVLSPHPFPKCMFLDMLARSADCGVIYLDIDMLYSGYVRGEHPTTAVHRPDSPGLAAEEWGTEMTALIRMVSTGRYLEIIDSLNGMNNMWVGRDAARLANYSVMLLAALGRGTGTRVVVAATAKESSDGWELAPGGRQALGIKGGLFVLENGSRSLRIRRDGGTDDPLDLGGSGS